MPRNTVPSESLDPVGQIVGYARVSTADQNLERQTDQLASVGAQRIFTDTITGFTRDGAVAKLGAIDQDRPAWAFSPVGITPKM